jgi:hypothetical protein
VQLGDSFPNGQVPHPYLYSAIISSTSREETDMDTATVHQRVEEREHNNNIQRRSKRNMVSRTIRRILRRTAAKEELLESEAATNGLPAARSRSRMDRTPAILAMGLVARGLVQPLDILLVCFLTGYFTILHLVARSARDNSEAPMLPALPPQGHVPAMVSNPLGTGFLHSKLYDLWLKLGVVTGVVGPLLLRGRYLTLHDSNTNMVVEQHEHGGRL